MTVIEDRPSVGAGAGFDGDRAGCGPTDIANGALICPRHHALLHNGFTATGDANTTITFYRPNHTILATTTPPTPPSPIPPR